MPYKEKEIKKVYFTVNEVAKMFNVATSLLRFWEDEFEILNPKRNEKGNRFYAQKDVDIVEKIYNLVKVMGMSHEVTKLFVQGTQLERLNFIIKLIGELDPDYRTSLAILLNGEMEEQSTFTTLYDSFGTPIHEGDTIEYFDSFYANDGIYWEGKFETAISKLSSGFIERAKEKGYTCEHKYNNTILGDCIQMMKPCVGMVKWNSEFATYEPIVDSHEDYNNNCFHYVVNGNKESGSYCKVIKRVSINERN